ncbi:hypothetical protein BDV95DRAFT_335089 [Massariosphaeria phaeospora]|uniref:F-box domain-containing protein n=1 Tax=Massariosphaeria phaeospora TaxID=100035 RepID=A0A7C8MC43_9PLEO|nr:hypothetical protein BDV95DRAFT_335089 [Massariosphaeria phaeospora]
MAPSASLPDLPIELLREIVSGFDQHTLVQLSLVCKKLVAVTEETLYKSPTILAWNQEHEGGPKLYNLGIFMTTLFHHRKLADRVEQLTVISAGDYPCYKEPSEEASHQQLSDYVCIAKQVRRDAGYDIKEPSDWPAWVRLVHTGKEFALFGAVLLLLPNLRKLDIFLRRQYLW